MSALPPYNEHLLRDFAAANLAIMLVLLGAAVCCERRHVQVAVVAFLAYSLPHLVYHLTTTDHYSTGDNIGSLGGFVVEMAIAIGVWWLTSGLRGATAAVGAAVPALTRLVTR